MQCLTQDWTFLNWEQDDTISEFYYLYSLHEFICNKNINRQTLSWNYRFILMRMTYTRSLVPADFSGVVFTCAHFQKMAQISSFCGFHYMSEGIPSLMT